MAGRYLVVAALLATLPACGSSSSGGGGAGSGGSGGFVSGLPTDPKCTTGTFGLSGRYYFPESTDVFTAVFPLLNPTSGPNSLDADLEGSGSLHVKWLSATGEYGDSLEGDLRIPGDGTHTAIDWCVDFSSTLVLTGQSADIDLYLAEGACPPPPQPGETPPPLPAVIQMNACWNLGP
jgi:hypothetical protein